MIEAEPPRPFFWPATLLTLLFMALGPAVGGAAFIPLAALAEADTQAAVHIGWIAGLIGHAFALIPAYALGLFPAAFTGLGFAIYDAWAPPRWPRALAAAAIGAMFAQALYLWLMWAGSLLSAWAAADLGDVVYDWTAGEFDASLHYALIVSGALSGFACAACAGLLGIAIRR
jgi:hypothetical protein